MLRSGGSIAWLFNNPGNLRPSKKYKGVIGSGKTKSGTFAIFASADAGRAEKKALLRRKYNPMTLRDAIHTYAPPTENDSDGYLEFVVKHSGQSEKTKFQDMKDDALEKVMQAMERMEGFNAKPETQKESWVQTTAVSLSDGARPLANQTVTVKQGGQTSIVRTNASGQLPLIAHSRIGEAIEFFVQTGERLEQLGTVVTRKTSQSVTYFRNYFEVRSITSRHELPPNSKKQSNNTPIPKRYVVQPGDTLSKIATKHRTTVDALMAANRNVVENRNRIFPGEVLIISGVTAQTASLPPSATRAGDVTPMPRVAAPADVTRTAPAPMPSDHHGSTRQQSALATRPAAPADATRVARPLVLSLPPRRSPAPVNGSAQITPSRSRDGGGSPLALVSVDQRRAPWMEHALGEAKRWAGKSEAVINRTINYHAEVGAGRQFQSIVGNANPWCASFVNYCVQQAGYPRASIPFRARHFSIDANFVKIDQPIYGAIAVFGRSGGGHVCFVYSLSDTSGQIIVLGGNQGDQINFVSRSGTRGLVGFFVPIAYKAQAEEDIKKNPLTEKHSAKELNDAIGAAHNENGSEV
jgi:uncharacterized protein (TIGR02594 family)